MAALALPHGNADVERSFSTNKKLLTVDRAKLCPQTINACRLVKDALKNNAKSEALNAVITPALLRSARSSYGKYKEFLEEERKRKEKEMTLKLEKLQRKLAEEEKRKEEQKRKEKMLKNCRRKKMPSQRLKRNSTL
jgi:hypothetical protein